MLSWYALNSKPHSEKSVCEALEARGLESYLPAYRVAHHGRRAQGAHPFFPCYLFARADLDDVGLSALQYLPGVRRLVFYGDQPARVPQGVIDEIRVRLGRMQGSVADAKGQPMSPGDTVLITGGPLAGLEASFDGRASSAERVRLLVNFLQTGARLEIDSAFVKKKGFGRANG